MLGNGGGIFSVHCCKSGGLRRSSKEISGGGQTSEEKSAEEKLAGELSGDMASVYGKDEYTKMYDEFRESGSFDKMNPMKWVFCIPDDKAEEMLAEEEDELAREFLRVLLFDADSVKKAYDEEETIMLFYPDESFINRTLAAVGMESNYVLSPEEAPDGKLELFAIAKRTINDRTHTFTYKAACDDAFTISDDLSAPPTGGGDVTVSGDKAYVVDENGNIISSSDVTTGDKEEIISDYEKNKELFTVERWRSYYNWAASLTEWANEQSAEASSIEIRSAADGNNLTAIAEAQTETIDCSFNWDGYMPRGNINYCDAVNVRRANTVSFVIYSCHSFTNGSDYYLVKANARTATNYYQDRVVTFTWGDDSFNKARGSWLDLTANMGGHKDPVNYISGFTKSMTIYAPLHNGHPGILANTPMNVAKETQYSNTIGWNIGGPIGGSKDGVSGSLTGGVSYSETKSFTQKAYEIKNALNLFDPSWVLTYTDGISEGSWNVNGLYQGINPPAQSMENVEFESAWIWEVGKSVWGTAGKTLTMGLDFWNQDGFAFGNGFSLAPNYAWNTQEKYPYFLSRNTVTLKAPAHFWLSNRTYPIDQAGGKATFEVLAEYDWKMSADRSWIHLLSPGGSATGADKYLFMLEVDANNTGAMRTGNIIFEMTYNGNIESKDIQVSQASR